MSISCLLYRGGGPSISDDATILEIELIPLKPFSSAFPLDKL